MDCALFDAVAAFLEARLDEQAKTLRQQVDPMKALMDTEVSTTRVSLR